MNPLVIPFRSILLVASLLLLFSCDKESRFGSLEREKDTPTISLRSSGSVSASGDQFVSDPFLSQDSIFQIKTSITVSQDPGHAIIGSADSTALDFEDMAVGVRFDTTGVVNVRDDDSYESDIMFAYNANTEYELRMLIDVVNHTYSVYINESGKAETLLRENATFRDGQQNILDLNHLVVWARDSEIVASDITIDKVGANEIIGAGDQFTNFIIPEQDFMLHVTAMARISDHDTTHCIIGSSYGEADDFPDLAVALRFNQSGYIDVRSGSGYTNDTTVYYEKDVNYRVRFAINIDQKTYDAFVQHPSGTEIAIKEDADFRTEQSNLNALNRIVVWGRDSYLEAEVIWASDDFKFQTIDYTSDEVDVFGQVWQTGQSAELPHSVQKSADGHVYRFEVHKGENKSGDSDGVDRSELQKQGNYAYNTDLWISYAMKLENTEGVDTNSRVVIGQWHGGNSPPMSFRIRKGIFSIESYRGTASNKIKNLPNHFKDSIKIKEKVWYHMVGHMKFNPSGNAELEVWRNGEKIVDDSNFSMGYTDRSSTYWKFGIYRNDDEEMQAIQYANMEVGTDDLSDRINSPLPIIP